MNNYELHMKTHTCHDDCQNPICVAVREAIAAEREANKDRIETLYQMYKMASQQRDELMRQQTDAIRERGAP